jgi:site-specific recombinase XerD
MHSSLTENSWSTYQTALNAYQGFLNLYNFSLKWPLDLQHIILFISYCFEKRLSPNSIKTYLAGLNYFHKLHGWYDIRENFVVTKLLEGCSRLRKTRDTRAPITKNILSSIILQLPNVCYNLYETDLFKAIFTLAYFGLFRVSELVATMKFSSNQLQFNDVHFSPDQKSVSLVLRKFKTNQRGVPTVIKIAEQGDTSLCPIKLLLGYLAKRPTVTGPLFCHADSTPVSRNQFAAVLFKAIKACSFHSLHFQTHSFRIGRASDLAAAGVSVENIMQMGRWSSDAYKYYIR